LAKILSPVVGNTENTVKKIPVIFQNL
jgi:hypothetical protein